MRSTLWLATLGSVRRLGVGLQGSICAQNVLMDQSRMVDYGVNELQVIEKLRAVASGASTTTYTSAT